MKDLILKEVKLAMHPTAIIFILLSAMLIIPNYPYLIIFFYTSLAIFFTCLNGRENHDIFYTMLLPIRKRDIVKTRFAFVIILELVQIIVAIPFSILRQSFNLPGNQVGIDANIALFGFAFIMLGLFNLIFFSIYYCDVSKVGKPFMISNIVVLIYICTIETLTHVFPLFKYKLDTNDPQFLSEKMILLLISVTIFIILTFFAYKISAKRFEKLDL